MISAKPGWVAHFTHPDSSPTTKPIEAWDGEGYALVVNSKSGRLIRARDYGNFDGIGEDDDRYMAAVSGQGWYVERTDDDGTKWADPVIAFVIDRNGWGRAVLGSRDGLIEPDSDHTDGERRVLTPPGGWPEPDNGRTAEASAEPINAAPSEGGPQK